MEPWRPWDATDEEYKQLRIIRESVLLTLEDPIREYLDGMFTNASDYGVVRSTIIHTIETALREKLDVRGTVDPSDAADAVMAKGSKFALRVVDFLLAHTDERSAVYPYGVPIEVEVLTTQMDYSGSAVKIAAVDGHYRVVSRLPEGVEEAAQEAINASNVTAGQHLANAWREMQSLEPDANKILREGIQAVEAAAGEKVIPNDKRPQLSKIVGALRDQHGWGLVLARRDDNHPDHLAVLIGMLETLAFAEQHRHSGHGYSKTEAIGHVELAATLVGWFSADVVVRRDDRR